MSRDIRSFFTKSPKAAPAAKKTKLVSLISSDEDDTHAATSKKEQKKQQKKPSSKPSRQAISSDSDEEAPTVVKVIEKSEAKETAKKEQLKPVSLRDVFGKKSIKRVNAPAISSKLQKKEAEFHDDDDFAAVLGELDTSQLEHEFLKSVEKESSSKRQREEGSDEDVGTEIRKKIREIDEKSLKEGAKDDRRDKEASTEASSNSRSTVGKSKTASKVVVEKTTKKTNKTNKEKNDAADELYAENIDKKKQRAILYDKYRQRGGARNPGSKPIPEGANNCLAGLSFVVTGVLDSLEREDAEELIKKYAGRVSAQVSKKTNYMVVGDEAGPTKLAKAESFGTKQISEDELLDLIRTRPEGKAKDVPKNGSLKTRKRSRSPDKATSSPSSKKACLTITSETPPREEPKAHSSTANAEVSKLQKNPEDSNAVESRAATSTGTAKVSPPTKIESTPRKDEPKAQSSSSTENDVSKSDTYFKDSNVGRSQALVDKYKPKSMKQIIGQHSEKSNARKLEFWLRNWHKNQNGNTKLAKPSPWAKNDDGAFFKACMLSGPPGVGKTTTAQVVCDELGYDLLEFNASDTRSKRLLKEEVAGILSNTTVKGYFGNVSNSKLSRKHVLLMDEVDGMAGNEDRGGLQELITLIKSSEVPIICICNDRNHPKMRTLSNYTFDLRFQKPRLEQIRGAMKSMCCKENIVISTEELDRLIQSTNQDIRQVINHLAMLSGGSDGKDKTEGKQMNKDLRLGPWDVINKVFSSNEHRNMSIHDKSGLFFHDYNIAALFVQENYLSVTPNAPKDELLERIAKTADSLAMGDLIENAIRGNGAWSLLPTQACFSSVIPGALMSGHITAKANFPAWLGRNSRRGKFDRLLQEITVHSRLATGASKEAINIDYLNHLRDAVIRPLALEKTDGIEESLNVMNHYHLLREDLESLVEVSLWPGQQDPLQVIDSKVKAAFTRAYNKSSAPAPYLMNAAAPKKKTNQASQDEGFMEGEDEDVVSDTDNDNMESDRMIKAKKATAAGNKAPTSSKTASKPKRGRGRGKAK